MSNSHPPIGVPASVGARPRACGIGAGENRFQRHCSARARRTVSGADRKSGASIAIGSRSKSRAYVASTRRAKRSERSGAPTFEQPGAWCMTASTKRPDPPWLAPGFPPPDPSAAGAGAPPSGAAETEVDGGRALATRTLQGICRDEKAPSAARAQAARTLLELCGALKNVSGINAKSAAEMTLVEIDARLVALETPDTGAPDTR